jgi:hypothetical protein
MELSAVKSPVDWLFRLRLGSAWGGGLNWNWEKKFLCSTIEVVGLNFFARSELVLKVTTAASTLSLR